MSTTLLAAGVACSGAPGHDKRHWAAGGDRRVRFRDTGPSTIPPALAFALKLPIPGEAPPLVADPWHMLVLLSDGAAYHLDQRGPKWRPLTEECHMGKAMEAPPAFIAGGSGCGVLWVATPDRRLWVWGPTGRTPIGESPVPGAAGIIAVDAAHRAVVLDDGSRFEWLGGRWFPIPGLLEMTAGTIRVKGVRGIALGGARGDIHPGDVTELPEADARRLIASGHVTVVDAA